MRTDFFTSRGHIFGPALICLRYRFSGMTFYFLKKKHFGIKPRKNKSSSGPLFCLQNKGYPFCWPVQNLKECGKDWNSSFLDRWIAYLHSFATCSIHLKCVQCLICFSAHFGSHFSFFECGYSWKDISFLDGNGGQKPTKKVLTVPRDWHNKKMYISCLLMREPTLLWRSLFKKHYFLSCQLELFQKLAAQFATAF